MLCGNPGRGTAVGFGGSFNQTTGKVFSAEYAIYCNLFRISRRGEAINYRRYASPSFQVAKPRTLTDISAILIIQTIHLTEL